MHGSSRAQRGRAGCPPIVEPIEALATGAKRTRRRRTSRQDRDRFGRNSKPFALGSAPLLEPIERAGATVRVLVRNRDSDAGVRIARAPRIRFIVVQIAGSRRTAFTLRQASTLLAFLGLELSLGLGFRSPPAVGGPFDFTAAATMRLTSASDIPPPPAVAGGATAGLAGVAECRPG